MRPGGGPRMKTSRAPGVGELPYWLALAAAFSPVLPDLVAELWVAVEDRPALLTPLLLAWCLRHSSHVAEEPRRDGLVLLAVALLLELVGIVVEDEETADQLAAEQAGTQQA